MTHDFVPHEKAQLVAVAFRFVQVCALGVAPASTLGQRAMNGPTLAFVSYTMYQSKTTVERPGGFAVPKRAELSAMSHHLPTPANG